MMPNVRTRLSLLLGVLPLVAAPTAALATNGMNMIGYGAVSSSMGGADLAVTDNPSAMNINPAGLCECATPEIDAGVSVLMPFLRHEDELGNEVELAHTCEAYATFLEATGQASAKEMARELRDRALEIQGRQLASGIVSLPPLDSESTDPGIVPPTE